MRLKKLFVAFVALIATATMITPASAQINTEGWTGGAKLSIYTNWDTTMGIGVYGRHAIGENLRIEPSFSFLCKKGMSVDITADLHYPIELSDGFEAYPLAGLSLNDPGKFGLGINLGGGLGYKLSDVVNVDFGLKWTLQTQEYVTNPFIISFGVGYKF